MIYAESIDEVTTTDQLCRMGRPRKRHVQVELQLPKLDKNKQRRGGYRPGAGRKPNGERAGASHATRAPIKQRNPQHVTLRVANDLGWLRRLDMYAAVRRALRTVLARHEEFRVVHLSLQNTHLHLIVEANDQTALANGLRTFQISAAKRLNAAYSRRRRVQRSGRVFTHRYHCENLDSVRQVRNALAYVINDLVDTYAELAVAERSVRSHAAGSCRSLAVLRDRPRLTTDDVCFRPDPNVHHVRMPVEDHGRR